MHPHKDPPTLEAAPILSIECKELKLPRHHGRETFNLRDTFRLKGGRWNDDFHWDLVSREVEMVRAEVGDPHANSSKKFATWRMALQSPIGNILRHRIGEQVEDLILWAQQIEWDQSFLQNLARRNGLDKFYGIKTVLLLLYNEESGQEEFQRRLATLDDKDVCWGVNNWRWYEAWKPKRWEGADSFSDEEWYSVKENFPKAREAIKGIPMEHLRRRRLEGPGFWTLKKEAWRRGLEEELLKFRSQKEEFGGNSMEKLVAIQKSCEIRINALTYIRDRIVREKEEMLRGKCVALDEWTRRLPNERKFGPLGRGPSEEVMKLRADFNEYAKTVKEEIRLRGAICASETRESRSLLEFTNKYIQWQKHARADLLEIRQRAARKLTKIERLQAKESQELFPPTCSKSDQAQPSLATVAHPGVFRTEHFQEVGLEVQWTQAREVCWRNQLGDTRVDPEQLSSRRGPPRDRPPGRPPPCKGASRGCLRESAGTLYASQSDSFTRVSHSLSGNATSLQTMQNKVCAPSNYSASPAVGSSPGVSRRVRSWKHTDAGRSRVNGFVPNLGRDLVRLPRTKSAGSVAQS
jgi:hypothetical protein